MRTSLFSHPRKSVQHPCHGSRAAGLSGAEVESRDPWPLPLFLLLVTFGLVTWLHAAIQIQGMPPAGIDAQHLPGDYARIWRIVAPDQFVDDSGLCVRYCSRRQCADSGIVLPEWGGGGAIGGRLVVVYTDAGPLLDQNLAQVTLHELVHVAVARACPSVEIPRWFHEGTAMLLSGEMSFEEQTVLSRAILTGSLLPLSSIDSVNQYGRFRADLSYCQSRQAVLALVERYGIESIGTILEAAQRQRDFWAGVDSAVGLNAREVENLARGEIVRKFALLFFVVDNAVLWIATAVLFLVAVAVTLVRDRRKRHELAEAEVAETAPASVQSRSEPDPVDPADRLDESVADQDGPLLEHEDGADDRGTSGDASGRRDRGRDRD